MRKLTKGNLLVWFLWIAIALMLVLLGVSAVPALLLSMIFCSVGLAIWAAFWRRSTKLAILFIGLGVVAYFSLLVWSWACDALREPKSKVLTSCALVNPPQCGIVMGFPL